MSSAQFFHIRRTNLGEHGRTRPNAILRDNTFALTRSPFGYLCRPVCSGEKNNSHTVMTRNPSDTSHHYLTIVNWVVSCELRISEARPFVRVGSTQKLLESFVKPPRTFFLFTTEPTKDPVGRQKRTWRATTKESPISSVQKVGLLCHNLFPFAQ